MTTGVGTGFAKPAAFVAHIIIAATAPASLFGIGTVPTVGAGDSVVTLKPVKCATRIVIPQHLSHRHKKIKYATLRQCRSNQIGRFPFAQGAARHVRMGILLVGVDCITSYRSPDSLKDLRCNSIRNGPKSWSAT